MEWTEERSRFKAVTENTSLMAWASDESGSKFYFSTEWFRFTGAGAIGDAPVDWSSHVHGDERAEVKQAFSIAHERRIAFGMDYRLLGADGTYARVWDVGLPKFDNSAQFSGYYGTLCVIEKAAHEPLIRVEGPSLSLREQEVLKLVAEGNTSATIGAMLGISVRTVEMHVEHAVTKLGAFNRVHAVAKAMRLQVL